MWATHRLRPLDHNPRPLLNLYLVCLAQEPEVTLRMDPVGAEVLRSLLRQDLLRLPALEVSARVQAARGRAWLLENRAVSSPSSLLLVLHCAGEGRTRRGLHFLVTAFIEFGFHFRVHYIRGLVIGLRFIHGILSLHRFWFLHKSGRQSGFMMAFG